MIDVLWRGPTFDYVLGSLRVTTYEPRGNLRPPAQ